MDPTISKSKLHRALQLTLRNRRLRLSRGALRLLSGLESTAAKAIAGEPSTIEVSGLAPGTPEQAAAVAMQSFESLLSEVERIVAMRTRRGGQSGGGLMRSPKRTRVLIATMRTRRSGQSGGGLMRSLQPTIVQEADIWMALGRLCPLWPFC